VLDIIDLEPDGQKTMPVELEERVAILEAENVRSRSVSKRIENCIDRV
jgi:hypothetical protein